MWLQPGGNQRPQLTLLLVLEQCLADIHLHYYYSLLGELARLGVKLFIVDFLNFERMTCLIHES